MKAPYIFSLLSPIVFKTAISFAFMTAAKRQRKKGGRARSNGYFLPPHSVLIFTKQDLKGPLHYIFKNYKILSLYAYLTSRIVCKTLDGIL